jgi:hypothetical protein
MSLPAGVIVELELQFQLIHDTAGGYICEY